ncbi:putative disease resistance protein RGA1 [Abrus precatorius]|uniref:Disease resistance protein RGA1 n=1 Tax=Abrus precatorius TaxID=3816 RepID=A0A8B8JXD4_ABRPR|nr:putative disease resistance protein RGA1 [Abrus precatorius]XP_027336000.1 putative disease resistance protein RGA1 [Abrus precatorius]
MAEHIPFAVASNLVHRLASADFHEFGRKYDVTEELEELKNTIESINDVLLDADDKQEQARVRVWIRRFKEVLHVADDFLDDLAIEFMRHKLDEERRTEVTKVLYPFSSSNRIDFPIQMAEEIKRTRESFDAVVKDMYKLNLSPRSGAVKQTNSEWRETCSFVLESDIIGRDDSKKEIISLLKQPCENRKVSVIAVVGLGGLGKTTLAQLVYNDLEAQGFFEKQMWVCVSDNFDVKTILKKILESITDCQRQDQSLEKMQRELHTNLRGKKYLLVLDDIWNERHDKWAELRKYLMCGAQDSKILVTTRSENVAKATAASTSYPLKGLTDEESWSLLKNIAFEDNSKGVNQNLESMGKEIAKKCKGVPLAVKTLGGLLREQNEESEWENVLHGDLWKLCEEQDSIMPILKLSYQKLLPEMRQCFAYCSLYPKDWKIYKDELIQLWMAQGYLKCPTEKQNKEDIGNQFVKMFLMNSFFQDAESDEYGEIYRFKMHDLMHDLAMLVAGNDYCYLDSKVEKVEGSPMHVSLESKAIHLLDSLDKSKLRTLIFWSDTEQELFANFKYLRVLKTPSSTFCKLFGSVGKLKHLRYLDIVGAYYSLSGGPVGLGNLCTLQFLSIFVVGGQKYCTLNELKDLNLRGKLIINNLYRVRDVALESQDVNLKEKNSLQHLILDWFDEEQRDIQTSDSLQLLENLQPHHNLKRLKVNHYPGVLFPSWLSLLTNIVEISFCKLYNCRCLPPLEGLQFLKSLEIVSLDELEYIYLREDGSALTFFSTLENLSLCGCEKLRGWRMLGDDINDSENSHHLSLLSFPRLSHLKVTWCSKLTCMPTFPTVTNLFMGQCSVEPLTATLNTTESTCSADSSSCAAPLSMLKHLHISDSMNLPKGWMQDLTSLESLRLVFWESETLEEIETQLKDTTNCLPNLLRITMDWCPSLKALPKWICNLSSLQRFEIFDCPELASLPEGMSRLTSLKTFEVARCSLLIKECRTETSAVSRQIAHIPQIILRDEFL